MTMATKAVIRAELMRIRASYGHLDPEVILAEATPHNAVLHGEFEWDNSIAGHQHRLEQARRLVKVVVNVEPSELGGVVVVPSFVSERRADGTRSYEPIHAVMSDKHRRYALTVEAITRARDILRNCPAGMTQRLAALLDKRLTKLKP